MQLTQETQIGSQEGLLSHQADLNTNMEFSSLTDHFMNFEEGEGDQMSNMSASDYSNLENA